MKPQTVIYELFSKKFIEENQKNILLSHYNGQIISLYYDLTILNWLARSILIAGISLYVQRFREFIPSPVIIVILGTMTFYCFRFAERRRYPFSFSRAESPSQFYDGILMIGGLILISLEGYLEYKYQLFSTPWNIGILLTVAFLSVAAYRYDHRGILSLSAMLVITWASSSWAGSGLDVDRIINFDIVTKATLVDASLVSAIVVFFLGGIISWLHIKPHFITTYVILCSNIVFIAALTGFFQTTYDIDYLYIIAASSIICSSIALRLGKIIIFVYSWIYFYFAFSVKMSRWIDERFSTSSAENWTLIAYLIVSGPAISWFIRHMVLHFFPRLENERLSP